MIYLCHNGIMHLLMMGQVLLDNQLWVHLPCAGRQLVHSDDWWLCNSQHIARTTTQRDRAGGQKEYPTEGAKDQNLQTGSLKNCSTHELITTTIASLRGVYKPATKTVANASDAHMPHFKWPGSSCESTPATLGTTLLPDGASEG